MPNIVDANGITIKTLIEIVDELKASLRSIYGSDINLDSDTPDGQIALVFAQAIVDLEGLIEQVYNSMDPDTAMGIVLDARVAINGIQRQAGTYSITPVEITIDRTVTLYGLDQDSNDPYIVSDDAGNNWILLDTISLPSAASYLLNFRAEAPGDQITIPDTINNAVTIVLGVTGVNNPGAQTSIGINEETDYALRIRRQQSVSLASQGYRSGLLAALRNINGITSAFVYENTGNSTDGDGVPGHSIWVIVAGTYDPADVAQAIYTKRNAGCGMYGQQSYVITQEDDSPFEVLWDNVDTESLYIRFTVTSLDGIIPPNVEAIRNQLKNLLVPGVNQKMNINMLGTLVQQIDSNALVTDAGFSFEETGPFTVTLSPSSKNKQFIVTSENTIVLPMQISPINPNVEVGDTRQFLAYGGFGSYTFTLFVNNSGGSITSGGLYTAGVTANVTDTIRVTDSLGNYISTSAVVINA